MFKQAQRLGKAFMLPIAILPAAGLLLGIGGALSNPNTVAAYGWLGNTVLQAVFQVMAAAGTVVFANLAMIMAVGLAVGLAKADKGVAALASVVAFLVMNATGTAWVHVFRPDGGPLDTGVIGSIVIAVTVTWLHGRYADIQVPSFLGFFGGSRFIPIVSALAGIVLGSVFFLVWTPLQDALVGAGEHIAGLGAFGTFLYGTLLRLTGAVGLHHTIYPLFWYTELGGTEIVAGQSVSGAQKIFFAQLADPNHTGLYTEGTRFFAGRFATMMFALPAAALAMYHAAPSRNRKLIAGLLFSAALTSFLTGITEPLEFMFLFVAPFLYVIHAILDGLSFAVADILNINIGNTFSGGAIDFTLFGILQGQDKTHWMYVIPVGLVWALVYYVIFRVAIARFNLLTPGRGDDASAPVPTANGVEAPVGSDVAIGDGVDALDASAGRVLAALGGPENIEDVDACITRLRVAVRDSGRVDRAALKSEGAIAVLDVKGGIQAIYGAKADPLKTRINKMLGSNV